MPVHPSAILGETEFRTDRQTDRQSRRNLHRNHKLNVNDAISNAVPLHCCHTAAATFGSSVGMGTAYPPSHGRRPHPQQMHEEKEVR